MAARYFHLPPDGTHEGGRTTRQTRHRFALRRPESGEGALRRIGITLSRAPQPGRCRAQPTLSNSHLARPNGEARGLLVVPRWFLTKFPIYGTAPQHKLSRVKPLGYAARQLTIELPTSSDKVWRSMKNAFYFVVPAGFTIPRGWRLLSPIAPGRMATKSQRRSRSPLAGHRRRRPAYR
jgi:hypothetical protein